MKSSCCVLLIKVGWPKIRGCSESNVTVSTRVEFVLITFRFNQVHHWTDGEGERLLKRIIEHWHFTKFIIPEVLDY